MTPKELKEIDIIVFHICDQAPWAENWFILWDPLQSIVTDHFASVKAHNDE